MIDTLNFTTILTAIECCWVDCKEKFAVDTEYRKTGKSFRCPKGHLQFFTVGETEMQRLKRELQSKEMAITVLRDQVNSYRYQRDRQIRRTNAVKGQLTKLRKRVSKGVCSQCNRYFSDLHRHMDSKHKPKK